MDNYQEVLVRDPKEFPEELRIALDIVTMNESPRVVGSSAYSNFRFPSDVDVFERVTVRLPREKALIFYEDQFRNIMEKILVEPELYYMDFKAGQDLRYALEPAKTVTERRIQVDDLYNQDLLTHEESIEFYRYADDEEEFREALRQKQILRWTPEEVIEGRKELPGKRQILFREALSHPSIIKLDVVSWIMVRFQSIEVFYNLRHLSRTGPVELYPLGSYTGSLLADIKRYSNRLYYNPLKLAKRLWALSRVVDCTDLLTAINPLLNSDAAALNQINADIELLIDFIHHSVDQPKWGPLSRGDAKWSPKTIRHLFLELLGFHKRITNHLAGEKYQTVHQIIDQFFNLWIEWQVEGNLNRDAIIRRLQMIHEILKEEIYQQSHEYVQQLDDMGISCPIPGKGQVVGLNFNSIYF